MATNKQDDCILMAEYRYGQKDCIALNICLCKRGEVCPFYKSKEEYEFVSNNLLDGVRKKTSVSKSKVTASSDINIPDYLRR